jgi:hypothetical protein
VGEPHDCWTTTEAALTRDLSADLFEAWERLRETAVEFGEQRIYASLNSIMFSRRACYFFVRPKSRFLEVCVFLGRAVTSPLLSRVRESSKTKFVHTIKVTHRDQVEQPITDWLHEAYEYAGPASPTNARTRRNPAPAVRGAAKSTRTIRKTTAKKTPARRKSRKSVRKKVSRTSTEGAKRRKA